MHPLGRRTDGSSDGVTMVEKSFDDVDGQESVRASDEDFISRSNGGHFTEVKGRDESLYEGERRLCS